jgi:hypothetical protein
LFSASLSSSPSSRLPLSLFPICFGCVCCDTGVNYVCVVSAGSALKLDLRKRNCLILAWRAIQMLRRWWDHFCFRSSSARTRSRRGAQSTRSQCASLLAAAIGNCVSCEVRTKPTSCLNKIKQQHRYGLTLGFAYLMPDCWLEVSLHPDGPATGQLNQGFPWFSSVLDQINTELVHKFPRCTACFTCSPPQY